MRVSVCVGDYATTPYCVAGLEIEVYSMEELCYCIKENAFLLDFSLLNDGLVDWMNWRESFIIWCIRAVP